MKEHYSQKQKSEIDILQKRIDNTINSVNEFRKHLAGSKFHTDTTIQIKDVENVLLNLLDDLRGYA